MDLHAVDTETFPFGPGNMTPPLVCVSAFDGLNERLFPAELGLRYVEDLLDDPNALMVLLNAPYDMGVMAARCPDLLPKIFRKYDTGMVVDPKITQKLIDLADGELGYRHKRYSLDELAESQLGVKLDKDEDGWRKRYSELAPFHPDTWPERARRYAIDDAVSTYHLRGTQILGTGRVRDLATAQQSFIANEDAQVRADWALHLMSVYGIRTDAAKIKEARVEANTTLMQVAIELSGTGLIRGGAVSTKAVQGRVEQAYKAKGKEPPKTDPSGKFPDGQVQYGKEALLESGDPVLYRLAKFGEARMALSTYLPTLEMGVECPINTKFNSLLKTGRTSSSGPAFQNFPRKGKLRACVVPRPGYLLCSVDYGTIELVTLAQDLFEMFGETEMVKALREGRDLHVDLAALMLGVDYATAYAWYKGKGTAAQKALVKEKRQFCKPPNFGVPGGMQEEGLQSYAAGMEVHMTMAQCIEVMSYYHRRWPEMASKYFPFIHSLCGQDGYGSFIHPISGRKYGRGLFTEICNARFQGRAADGAKAACYEVSQRCYADRDSVLYGSTHPILFAHDEIIAEVAEEVAHEAAFEIARVMEESMTAYCPDIPFKAKPALMRCWEKDADDVYDDRKRLIAWERHIHGGT